MYISIATIHRFIVTLATLATILTVNHYRGLEVVSSKIFYNHVAVIIFAIAVVIVSSLIAGDHQEQSIKN